VSKYQKHFLITIVLVIAAVIINWKMPLVKGLDIAGGMRVVLQVAPEKKSDWPAETEKQRSKMKSERDIIRKRIQGFQGVSEPLVYIQGDNRLVVEMPGVKNQEEALDRIRSTASLKFYHLTNVRSRNNPLGEWQLRSESTASGAEAYIFTGPNGETLNSSILIDQPKILQKVVNARNEDPKDTAYNPKGVEPVLTGKDLLATANSDINQRQQVVINVEFNDNGTAIFRDFTAENIGEYLAIFLDKQLLTSPTIQESIPNGKAEITGFSSLQQALLTADYLNAGALPLPLRVLTKDFVEPTLGQETIKQVVLAGIIGLALVVLFMALYYRLPGFIADVALGLYTLFVLAIFRALGSTMSLAGIAALIISIGMAVDANILIFERLKEELRGGKTLGAAIDAGFARAFTAIFDSNMCTAITCVILMWYGSPAVKSFALTLLIGVAVSMFTAITVTRTILHLLVGKEWAQNPALYGLGTSWMTGVKWDIVGKRNYYFLLSAILIIPGIVAMALNYTQVGTFLKEGIEFKSGTSIQVTFRNPVNQNTLRGVVSQYSKDVEIQMSRGGRIAFIKTSPLQSDIKTTSDMSTPAGLAANKEYQLCKALDEKFGIATRDAKNEPSFDSTNSVGPTISEELKSNAVKSVLFAACAIILYLTFRFAIGSLGAGLKFGVCAVIALIHDALFILGLFAILGRFFGWEIDSLFVTAVLTIIGFSVHDTIVVFDRIRENLRHRERGEGFEALANRSIIQTLSRSINTSLTVVLTLATLIAFGGPLLRHFYVALLVGIIIGTYSSIFNATPLVIVWEKMTAKGGPEPRKRIEEKALVDKPMASIPGASRAAKSESSAPGVSSDGGESDAEKSARIKRKTTKKRRF